MPEELISIPEIAAIHARHRSTIHKIISRLGIETLQMKREESRGQKVAYLSQADYSLLKEVLDAASEPEIDNENLALIPGSFYLVQLEPTYDSGRFKVGFATDVGERLKKHKTSAPYASILKVWPCKLLWEKTAIECVTVGCEKLHTEVFRANDIDSVLRKADAFFSLMPAPKM
ncbi:MAG: hypothetical protein B7Y80_12230 [Hyphomicrobium sp. 32-62-53]|nr:MAG: hypothetical protein B7Y80_12230 [Hyphomicrobium sp. 32-62-53]